MKKRTSGKFLIVVCALLVAVAAFGADDKQKAYGVILATVFRESGHAMADAELALVADPEPPVAKKPKSQKLQTSPRGEAVFRVPPGPMRYTLTVKAKGYRMQSKTVQIQADERTDVNFLLEVDKK